MIRVFDRGVATLACKPRASGDDPDSEYMDMMLGM